MKLATKTAFMEYKHSQITQNIIGAALEVHKILGNGFQEVIYQRALDIELQNLKLLVNQKNRKRIKR